MRFHSCISICFKFLTPGWYAVTKGNILPVVFLVCFLSVDCLAANETSDNVFSIWLFFSELKDLICTRFQSDNKHVEKYNSVISEKSVAKPTAAKRLSKNNKRKKRRKNTLHKRVTTEREKNEKYLKNHLCLLKRDLASSKT